MSVEAFSSSDREFIRYVFSSKDWVDVYELHVQFQLSPGQIVDIVGRLRAHGYVELEGTRARLTPAGRDWVLRHRGVVFKSDAVRFRSELEEAVGLSPTIEPGKPYLPDLSEIDRQFFENLALPNSSSD
jgi:DNA-binding PadR family transcriptional regulator